MNLFTRTSYSVKTLKWALSMGSVVGIACFSLVIFLLNVDFQNQILYAKEISVKNELVLNRPTEHTFAKTIPTESSAGIPVRLKIAKIHVDTALERVGLTPDGAVGVPKGPSNAAWFDVSKRPGDVGNAIITGHYGRWKSGVWTVFNQLNKLSKGDKLLIEDDRGVVNTFVVRELKTFTLKDDVTDVFELNDGKSHLNLITCAGIWNRISKSYPKRLVVYTDKE